MGTESERKPSLVGDWAEHGFDLCPPSSHPEYASQSKSDHTPSAEKLHKMQDVGSPTTTAPGSNRSKEERGSV